MASHISMKARKKNTAWPRVPDLRALRPLGRPSAFFFAACLGIWLPKAYSEILVDLDASPIAERPLSTWKNNGTVGGDFTSPATAVPNVATQENVKGVTLNGSSHYYTGPAAPAQITGAGARTIEAW